MNNDATIAKERLTAKPSNRNGSKISQIKGYRIRARRAIGQHNTNRIHQSKKLTILFLFRTFAIPVPDTKTLLNAKGGIFPYQDCSEIKQGLFQ